MVGTRTSGGRRCAARLGAALLGLLLGLVLAEAGLQLGSVAYRAALDRQARRRLADEGVFRILCIGESTTRGVGDSSWPRSLSDALAERVGGALDVDVVNLGQPGSSSGLLAANIDAWLDLYRPDVVVTMIGINDDLNLLVSTRPVHASRPPLEWSRLFRFLRLSWRYLMAPTPPRPGEAAGGDGDDQPAAPDREEVAARIVSEIDSLEAQLVLRPDDPELLAALGTAAAGIGDTDRRLAALTRLVEVESGPVATAHALELADLLWNDRGDVTAAAAMYERVLAEDPDNRHALIRLADLDRDRRPARALQLLEHAFERYPTCHLSGLWLAAVLGAQGEDERAAAVLAQAKAGFEEALRERPGDHELWLEYALFLGTGNRPEARADVLRRALAAFPDDDQLRRALASQLFDLGRFDEAVRELEVVACRPQLSDRLAAAGSVEQLAVSLLLEHKGAGKVADFLAATGYHLPEVNPLTQRNYLAIADAIRRRGIRHVAMQYPTLPVAALQATLDYRQDIRYVDNGPRFAAALAVEPYEDLFSDRFAGSFGHLTARGNALVIAGLLPELEPLLPRSD